MTLAKAFLAVLAIGAQGPPPQFVHEPFDHYQERTLHGFKVRLSFAARQNPLTTQPAYTLLGAKLLEVAQLVPGKALKTLQKIPIFIEHMAPDHPCACYHPNQNWLKEHGYIAQKWRSVEIANAANFVDWIQKYQPMMVLHELAHGFHDLEFGYQDAYIESCHRLAQVSGKYESVEHADGTKKRHYALTNPQEYFAECTEAYFGKNDFYPFTKDQLKQFDPTGYDMVERMWGITAPARIKAKP